MYKVSDGNGNSFFTDSSQLATRVVVEVENSFCIIEQTDEQVKEEHIVNDYDKFLNYFY